MVRLRRLLFGQELSLAPTKWVVRLADAGSRKNVMLVNSLALALDRLLLPEATLRPQARDRRTANRGCGPSAPSRRRRPTQPRNSTRRCIRFRSITRPPPVHFGEGTTAKALDAEIARMGDVVMLSFGGGSIKPNGLHDQVRG